MLLLETPKGAREYPDISDPFFADIAGKVRPPYADLRRRGGIARGRCYQSIGSIVRHRIQGDIVECGVWSGGSMLLAAHALMHFGDTSRRIFIYNTYAGMPKPDAVDRRWDGVPALPTWEHYQRNGRRWCFGVRRTMSGRW